MWALVLSAALSQAPAQTRPEVAVVLSTRRPKVDAIAGKIAERAQAALVNEGIDSPLDPPAATRKLRTLGYSDPRKCQGAVPCLARLAKLLGPDAIVIGVDVGQIARSLAIHIDAVTASGDTLASLDLTSSVDQWPSELSAPLAGLARKVADKLAPPAQEAPTPPVASDAPVAPPHDSAPSPPPLPTAETSATNPVVVTSAPPKRSLAAPIAVGATAVAAFAVAGVFGGLGLQDMNTFNASRYPVGGQTASTLPQSRLDALSNSANTRFTIALSAAVVGAALGAGSAFLFARN